MHCKGEDPCASGAPLEACTSCSSLTEIEWHHLGTVFQERSVKHASKNTLESMDTSIPQAAAAIKKGLKGVKGSASIAPSTIKGIVSPPPPPVAQPLSESPLQRLEKGDYGLETGSSYSSTSQVDKSELEHLAPPPNLDAYRLKRQGSSHLWPRFI